MASTNYVSSDEYKQQKALEEARKAGKIPAQLDEEGKEINPHMPQYITKAPWYLNQNAPSMKHQYFFKQTNDASEEFYARGQKGYQATKYRKGACTNCGAITHQAKDCCERPRKLGAKYTNQNIAADDIIKDIKFTYDSKRHNWNGFDPDDYMEIVKEKEKIEEIRKREQEKQLEKADAESNYDDGTREKDEKAGQVKISSEQSRQQPTPHLRIREDKAKYLRNLSEDSATFISKNRSMRENPTPNDPNSDFKGENALRMTGGAVEFIKQEYFAWQAAEKQGLDLSSIANPTLTEKVYREMKNKESTLRDKNMQKVFVQYGGEEHFEGDMDLILGQTEKYAEYAPDGTQLDIYNHKRSKYAEDIYINNHTSVWGSWFNDYLGWGYACCHSNTKSSTCQGEKGIKEAVTREFLAKKQLEEDLKKAKESGELEKKEQQKKAQEKPQFAVPAAKKKTEDVNQKGIGKKEEKINDKKQQKEEVLKAQNPFQWGLPEDEENEQELDQEKVKYYMERMKENKTEERDDRKRKYNSFAADEGYEISREELEAYRLTKKNFDDPMANYQDNDKY
ncbi:Pre-mRNA-splicing factor SLU7 (macronuclear) [Tetrahymena thermophila SB210]|uniref:Pre-mRNA-splicing factor SLU7 n=1 Tax=Tetrahymena thermophila (strain SB210) TaxID=312017 RepID=I7M991_TETTS|nr:Pre-mRNA-splicing factor SLU7 [Tetrahymena thermophila SB210]EAS01139.2 Pre-mRNA-splicing factor SLU7 [Tetrahymena thermophila SB210]|eukprot:XP_001021384.2 Pre-mRNA-splicing factor SLU7 [Tetrahymena thermophila SB210]